MAIVAEIKICVANTTANGNVRHFANIHDSYLVVKHHSPVSQSARVLMVGVGLHPGTHNTHTHTYTHTHTHTHTHMHKHIHTQEWNKRLASNKHAVQLIHTCK